MWIHFQLIDLCAALSTAQIRTTLDNLPDGLGETYQRILTNVSKTTAKARFARILFRWLACARRPLRIDEMQEAVAFDHSDKKWNAEKIPDADLLLQSCHSLVIRDHDNATVRFAHYRIQQYLVTIPSLSPPESSEGSGAGAFQFNMRDAENDAAKVCIANLNFSDFETAIAPRTSDIRFSNTGILGPGGPGTIATTLGIGKPVVDVVYRVLRGHARPSALDVDFAKYLNIRPKAAAPESSEKYVLLDYIIQHWPWHVDGCASLDTKTSGSLTDLVNSKTLPFEFRPWGLNRHFGPYGCKSCWTDLEEGFKPGNLILTSMMHWAAEHGLTSFLHFVSMTNLNHGYIRNQGCLHKHLMHEQYSNETMLTACRNGRAGMVDWLIHCHEQFGIKIRAYSSLCMAASASGNAAILGVLLKPDNAFPLIEHSSYGNFIVEVLQGSLFNAAASGNASMVDIRLRRGTAPWLQSGVVQAHIELLDEITGLTPLHSAAANGHHEVVRLLARACSYLEFEDMNTNSTALHYAAKNGHARVL